MSVGRFCQGVSSESGYHFCGPEARQGKDLELMFRSIGAWKALEQRRFRSERMLAVFERSRQGGAGRRFYLDG
jgi:hypothetical protein